jgi:hypothetical protein
MWISSRCAAGASGRRRIEERRTSTRLAPCSLVTATFARDDHRAAHASGHEVAVRDATLLGLFPTISSGTLLGYNRPLWRMTLRRFAVGARLVPEHYAAAGG